MVKLEHLDPMDFKARQSQSESLREVEPYLVPMEWFNVAESISEALQIPLYGKGWGPKIGEGSFENDQR